MEITWPQSRDGNFVPDSKGEYWNEQQETRVPEKRREEVLEKIRHEVRYAYENSGFYQEHYSDVSVDPTNITSFEEFHQLPVITAEDFIQEQQRNPPYGRFLCIDEDDIKRIHGTSGSTGPPKRLPIGEEDWKRVREAHAQILWSIGIRPDDVGLVAAPFIQFLGSWGSLWGLDRIGCSTIPLGAGMEGQSQQAVEWIIDLQPDTLFATMSYLFTLNRKAQEMGYDPAEDFSFKAIFTAGEPGASQKATRQKVESMFDCTLVDQGTQAEMTPWMTSSGCKYINEGMHLWQDLVYTELIDPELREVVNYGEEGVPTYTHLERTSMPLIRYFSGDISRWVSHEEADCDCGRTYPVLPDGLYGRIDDMLVIRGKNIFPSNIEEELRTIDDFGGEFRILAGGSEGPQETLDLVVEIADQSHEPREKFAKTVKETIKKGVGLQPDSVDPVGENELDRAKLKADRIKEKNKVE